MKKSELRDKIKTLVQQVYKTKSVDLDNGEEITLDAEKFPVLTKFPKLKDVIIDLLTDQYEVFMSAIEWVAPRPTTFRIVLGNDENFLLIYTERSWIAQVEGKKYYLLNLSEEEMAAESISRLLAYGAPSPAEGEAPAEGTAESPAAEETTTTSTEEEETTTA
jgi:restriction endonuclease S subunit